MPMTIFALESSAKAASCALLRDGRILGEQFLDIGLTHSQTLMPMAERLFEQTGLSPQHIDLFAVAAGPGSFTGIRIGVAAVKGMALAANRPCAPVSTLFSMCFSVLPAENDLICAVMDARREQVYNALFIYENNQIKRLCEDRALAVSDLCEELKNHQGRIVFIGDGAALFGDLSLFTNALLAPPLTRLQRASSVALAAGETTPVTAEALRPFYLRPPQAERELRLAASNRGLGPGNTSRGGIFTPDIE